MKVLSKKSKFAIIINSIKAANDCRFLFDCLLGEIKKQNVFQTV